MTSQNTLVSVIIPTYNRADLLRRTVESVLAQTYAQVELIVIDDGSTDHTAEVMAQYSDRVQYFYQANQGPDKAVAWAFQLAKGEYINFIDHDDLMMPNKLERQVDILDTHNDIDLVHCGYVLIDEDDQVIQRWVALPENEVLKNLVFGNFIWSGGPLIRRTCLETVGLFDDTIWSSDWDLWLRIALAGHKFYCIQEPLGAYRITPNSVMSNLIELAKGDYTILEQVFSDPRLPADIKCRKDEVYSQLHLRISGLNYASGQWEQAGHEMLAFLESRPDILAQPDELWDLFWKDILTGARVSDPSQVVQNLFSHLPEGAEQLKAYHSQFLANTLIALGCKAYAAGDIEGAQQHFVRALELAPGLIDHPDVFVQMVAHYAVNTPDQDPFEFVDRVFAHLPPTFQGLTRSKQRIQGEINIVVAFQDYARGDYRQAVPHILTGMRFHPASLQNRGVSSILLRSLYHALPRARQKGE